MQVQATGSYPASYAPVAQSSYPTETHVDRNEAAHEVDSGMVQQQQPYGYQQVSGEYSIVKHS